MIFIVDDSNAFRQRLVNMLSEIEGAEVIGQAPNAAEAIEGIRNVKPKVVLLDIQMPGGNGFEVLKSIRQDSHQPTIIMLTNHVYEPYREKCMELGADYFLDKTRDVDRLIEILEGPIKGSGPLAKVHE
jgi:DNA-binding NarL/FixJ family response regulator